MKLSLGPIQYYWSRETIFDFYDLIARSSIDIAYLGETVCSKRRSLGAEDWLEIAANLQAADKEVVLSSLALIEAESELVSLRRLCEQHDFPIEANDMAAVRLLEAAGIPFYTGPSLNIYNAATLQLLAAAGLQRWVLPPEVAATTLADISRDSDPEIETEVIVYGRLPLAYSARCFTARAHNLQKDACQDRCLDDPDGRTLLTRDGEPFLAINGIQTQSALTYMLLEELVTMPELGVDIVRLLPQSEGTPEIIETYAAVLNGDRKAAAVRSELESLMPVGPCNGYWHDEPGMISAKPRAVNG